MNYKKLLLIFLTVMMCLCLCACNAHKDVESQIAALGEITLDSKDELDAIAVAYSELSESQRKKVANYSDYKKALEKYDAVVYENIEKIFVETAVTDYGNHEDILINLNKYGKYFTEDQKNSLLTIYYFYEDAPQYVEDYITSRLKSPRSYYCYSMEVKCYGIDMAEDDEHVGTVDITYGAANSFGAEVTESLHFLISFKFNSNGKGITVTDCLVM